MRFSGLRKLVAAVVTMLSIFAFTAVTSSPALAARNGTGGVAKLAADQAHSRQAKPGVSATAFSAASCYNTTCKGKDPSAQGCGADAYTLTEFTDWPFRVELRYSPACYAAWTRVSTPSGTPGSYCNTAFAQIRGYDLSTDARKGVYGVQAACPGQRYTAMWPFSDGVRACISYYWFDADPHVCTARR
jgi:hypothetical protein